MSVQFKILAACLGFVAIIAMVGGLAQQQAWRMGRLAIGIYDHAFMGMSYVDQAQVEFLRFEEAHRDADVKLENDPGLQQVLDRLDVALERAVSERTRGAGKETRALVAALRDAEPEDLAKRMAQADKAIAKLVKKFSADGLEARDDAEELAQHSTRLVLIEIGIAIILALGVGFLVGRDLSRPLVQLVKNIDSLAAGDLEQEIAPRMIRRRDEIGAVARAAGVFRSAMRENAQAGEQHEILRRKNEADKIESLRLAANKIEQETETVAARSVQTGVTLAARMHELGDSAARVLQTVALVTDASSVAMQRSEAVAAAGEQLAASAREISVQINNSATEIASTARAGERANQILNQLSAAMGQIGSIGRLIGDIAGRTNLLALNATIEAARAGEAGRGFAVVANEVKTLATQTANSTKEIADNVASIQSASQEAVLVVAEMVDRVASIERITQSVASAAEQQTAATSEIARNVTGASDAMRAVTEQIEAVNREAQGNNLAITDMEAIAGEVSHQIHDLRTVMVRIVRTSSDAANRRADPRIRIDAQAILVVDGRPLPATCVDLSCGGARVRLIEALSVGTAVALRLPGLTDLPARVVTGGKEAGLNFDWEPSEAPAALTERIGQLTAAA
jgi:methyl-accepting chemotaxis protein